MSKFSIAKFLIIYTSFSLCYSVLSMWNEWHNRRIKYFSDIIVTCFFISIIENITKQYTRNNPLFFYLSLSLFWTVSESFPFFRDTPEASVAWMTSFRFPFPSSHLVTGLDFLRAPHRISMGIAFNFCDPQRNFSLFAFWRTRYSLNQQKANREFKSMFFIYCNFLSRLK